MGYLCIGWFVLLVLGCLVYVWFGEFDVGFVLIYDWLLVFGCVV